MPVSAHGNSTTAGDLAWNGVAVKITSTTSLPEVDVSGLDLRLRAFSLADLELIHEASADAVIPLLTTVPATYTRQEGEAFVERQLGRRTGGEGWSLAIHDTSADCAIGQIGLWLRNLSKGRAEIGYWVAPSGRGSGAAGRAVRLLSTWAFENLDISRLSLFIEPWNMASMRTAEAAGYEQEGLLKRWERVDGEAKDMYSYVLLAPGD